MAKKFPDTYELQKFELMNVQLPNLLRYEDKNSMAHSIESRLPFLDYRLVEYSVSIQPSQKMKNNWSKYILRLAMEKILPPNIIWRTEKRGFEAPSNTWMNERGLFLDEINKSPFLKNICKRIPSKMDNDLLWKLYNVSVWARIYNVELARDIDGL